MDKLRLGVLYGSRSCEHDVSVISAVQMMRAADPDKYEVIPLYVTRAGEWFTGEKLKDIKTYTPFDPYNPELKRVELDLTAGSRALTALEKPKGLFAPARRTVVARLDCVIPVFHGLHGEDGSMQGLLELADIPYASSGITASAVGMDKIVMKECFRGMGFPVLPDVSAARGEFRADENALCRKIEAALPYPVFVKPACLGSSIGVSRADDRVSLREALSLAFSFDRRVLIEKGLDKPVEVNCSVLGDSDACRASRLEMPTTSGDYLDFADKYLSGGGAKGMASLKRVIPAPVGDELTARIQALSCNIFRALDCKGVVRVDFMLDRLGDGLYITEINTIPGSLAFYLWEASGLPYRDLIDQLVEIALRAHKEKEENSFAFSSEILSGVVLGGKKGGKL